MNYTQSHVARESHNLSSIGALGQDPQNNANKPIFSTVRNRADLLASFTSLQQRYRHLGSASLEIGLEIPSALNPATQSTETLELLLLGAPTKKIATSANHTSNKLVLTKTEVNHRHQE